MIEKDIKFRFFVNENFDNQPLGENGYVEATDIISWFTENEHKMTGQLQCRSKDIWILINKLILNGEKNFFIWDDL